MTLEGSKFGGSKFNEPLRREGAKKTFSVERRLVWGVRKG